ncbi:trehalose-phosphatase [Chiayiivirga flava]|uniref:trehalose-phosphatase n=1 Tax=Chiayiivirga flava TaxID=659595 RepID=UPI00161E0D4D
MSDQRAPPPALDARCALFLDVDGTLLDFAPTPDGVVLSPAVPRTLQRLQHHLRGALALVSGRPIAQLDALFAPLRLPAAGLHGQERRIEDARVDAAVDLAPVRRIASEAQALARTHPGVIVEDKGANLALHWRAAPQAADAVRAYAHDAVRRLPGYRLQPGDHVLEFMPDGMDKGDAVLAFLREPPFRDRTPVFVGDDLTDEFGFAAAHDSGGWSVLVGGRPGSAARYGLAGPSAVAAWLERSAGALSSQSDDRTEIP